MVDELMFKELIRHNVKVFMDDMILKSNLPQQHNEDLTDVFSII